MQILVGSTGSARAASIHSADASKADPKTTLGVGGALITVCFCHQTPDFAEEEVYLESQLRGELTQLRWEGAVVGAVGSGGVAVSVA